MLHTPSLLDIQGKQQVTPAPDCQFSPMRLGRFGGIALLLALGTCTWSVLVRAGYGGNCYSEYDMRATECSQVKAVCSTSSCKSTNGEMQYTCQYPYACSGSYSESTVTGTSSSSSSTSTSTSTSTSNGADACNAMTLSSCNEAKSKFNGVGCSCFTCTETNGKIEASCSAPFTCTPQFAGSEEETTDALDMSSKDYYIVCAVYIATAIVLAGGTAAVTFFCLPKKLKGEPSSKQLVAKRMSWIPWVLYWGTLKSFVQDDGSPTGFVDYFCDNKELVGFLDCRKKTAAVRPRWMRFCAIITTLMVSISLACLLGTVVYNNENCATTRTVNDCCNCQTWWGGVDIGCNGCTCKSCSSSSNQCSVSQVTVDGATTTSTSFACESASVETSNKANWVTMILTLIMGKAGSFAINTAEDGSARQKLLHLVTGSVSIALIIFGVLYSQHLAKESDDDQEANGRRLKAIGLTLVAGWGYEQLVGFGTVFGQFVMYSIGYYLWYRPQLEEIKSAGAAAVHPHAGQGLDDSIMKTDGVKAAMGKPVALEEVTLQPPTQQQ